MPEILHSLLPHLPEPSATAVASVASGDCIPNCPICGGVGYVRYDVPRVDPRFGRIERCPHAQELDIQRRSRDPRVGLTLEEIRSLSWNSVHQVSSIHKYVGMIREALMARQGFILLVGPPGQGKSLILRVVTAVGVCSGFSAAYANMSAVLDDLRRSFDASNAGQELDSRMDWWMRLDVLALDEFDKLNATSWARERIHLLVDERYRLALQGRGLTLVASNSDPADEYILSRFRDARVGRIVRMTGADARTKARKEWPL